MRVATRRWPSSHKRRRNARKLSFGTPVQLPLLTYDVRVPVRAKVTIGMWSSTVRRVLPHSGLVCPPPPHSLSDVCAVCGVSATRSGGDFTTISVDWLGLVEFPRHITNEHSCWNPAECMDICQNLRDKGFTPDACT